MRGRWWTGLAGAVAGAAITVSAAERRPVTLAVTPAGPGLAVEVRGDAGEPVAVRYRLELDSRSRGGVNRTVQSGATRLVPGEPRVLLRSAIGSVGGGWRAVLEVTPEGGQPYRVERASDTE